MNATDAAVAGGETAAQTAAANAAAASTAYLGRRLQQTGVLINLIIAGCELHDVRSPLQMQPRKSCAWPQ